MKKVVQRICAICNIKKDKRELIRIVCNKDKEVLVDKTGKLQGRGAYICYNEDCLKRAVKSKKLNRVFETIVAEEIYEKMRGVIIDKEN